MSFKIIPAKLAKKDLLLLYNITHPTLRIWFRRAGLEEFVGRRKFLAHELVLIFQTLGRPRLARRAAQRLKDVYARINGLLPDEVRFREKYQQELPPQGQDRLPDSEQECDADQVQPLEDKAPTDPIHLEDALVRLRITAIYLLGQKGQKRQAQQVSAHAEQVCRQRRSSLSSTRHRMAVE